MNPKHKSYLIHGTLFVITFITTTLAGAEWTYGKSILAPGTYTWADFAKGLPYSVSFLLILTCHEFGHYFTALYYRVKTTLPFYIPLPPLPFFFGTLGALIRLKQPVYSNKQQFDIGIAGPLAGLVVAVAILIYGFVTLPPPEHIYQFHPEYEKYGVNYAKHVYDRATMPANTIDVVIGKNLLFSLLEKIFADPARMPNPHEIMHYPLLLAGFLSLLFTGLNLLPIGQLDGGHVLYGLVGYRWHKIIATTVFFVIVFISGLGLVHVGMPVTDFLAYGVLYMFFLFMMMRSVFEKKRDRAMYSLIIFTVQYLITWLLPNVHGYNGWLPFTMLIGLLVGVPHPPSAIEESLNPARKILGWLALVIFVMCITPDPINLIAPLTATP